VKISKLEDLQCVATCSIEEAANLVGLSRTKAYDMAKAGEIFEVIRNGKRIRIKSRPLYNLLMGSALDGETS